MRPTPRGVRVEPPIAPILSFKDVVEHRAAFDREEQLRVLARHVHEQAQLVADLERLAVEQGEQML